MKIPKAAAAFGPAVTLPRYLLVLTHPVGGPQPRYVRAHGFGETGTAEREAALLAIA